MPFLEVSRTGKRGAIGIPRTMFFLELMPFWITFFEFLGYTVVISEQTNKVPLLGDIPLVGELFKFHGESSVNSELVVFITPYLIIENTLSPREQAVLSDTTFPIPSSPNVIIKEEGNNK